MQKYNIKIHYTIDICKVKDYSAKNTPPGWLNNVKNMRLWL